MNATRKPVYTRAICAVPRLLEDQHARARLQQEDLRAAIAAGLAGGPGKTADTVLAELLADES